MSRLRVLEQIAKLSTRRPVLTLSTTVLIYVLLSLLALRIHIDVNFTSMVPTHEPAVEHVFKAVEYFGSIDKIFVAIHDPTANDKRSESDEANRLANVRACVDHLAQQALDWRWVDPANQSEESMVPLIQGHHDPIFKKVQADLLLSRSYLFLDQENLDHLIKRLHPRYLQLRLDRGPGVSVPAELDDRDLLGVWNNYLDFWKNQRSSEGHIIQDASYLCTPDKAFHMLMMNPRHPAKYMDFCLAMSNRLQSLQQELDNNPQWSHFKLHMVGGYISAARDFSEVRSSLIKTMLSSTLGIVLLFGIAYKSLRLIGLIGIGLIPAITASLGVSSILLGAELSIIISAFAAILIGLGVDFIIHLYNSYCWALNDNQGDRGAAARYAVVRVGPSIIIGCMTSVCTFMVLATSEFRGIFELGVISACGLLVILLSLILIVPSFLTIWGPKQTKQPRGLFGYGKLITSYPLPFGALSLAIIVGAFIYLGSSNKLFVLDDNMRNLRPYDAEYEKTLALTNDLGIRFGGHKVTLFGENEEAVLEASIDFVKSLAPLERSIPFTLAKDFSAADLSKERNQMQVKDLPENDRLLLARHIIGTPWGDCYYERREGNILHNLKAIAEIPADATVMKADTGLQFQALFAPSQLNATAKIGPKQQHANLKRLKEEVDWSALSTVINNATEQQRKDYAKFFSDFSDLQKRVNNDSILLTSELSASRLRSIVSTFYYREGNTHNILLTLNGIYDRIYIPLQELQDSLGLQLTDEGRPQEHNGITMGTCGIPTISNYIQHSIVDDFTRLTSIAMILVMVVLLIGVRQPLYVLLAMLTLGAGLVLTLSLMRACDSAWNILNISVIPLIIGIGIDNSIHFLHCLRHHSFDRNGIRNAIMETGHPIMMTALTSIIGFGSLMFNAYRGIQSIGMIASIGIFACMVAALFGLPLLIIGINHIFGKSHESDS